MDPNATLKRLSDALDIDELFDAHDAVSDLENWIAGGGFPPDWDAYPAAKHFYFKTVN